MKVDFIIHVTDRKKYINCAIKSLLKNELIQKKHISISCNSDTIAFRLYIKKIAKNFGIKYRESKAKGALEHFKESVNLSRNKYVCLLHDDDYVSEFYLACINDLMMLKKNCVAYSCETVFDINGLLWKPRVTNTKAFSLSPAIQLILYLLGSCGPAFPSVIYKRNFIKNQLKLSGNFGKYSDAEILFEASKKGLYISPHQNFYYRIHANNDSKIKDLKNKKKLRIYLLINLIKSFLMMRSYNFLICNIKYCLGRFIKKSYYEKC